MSILNSQLSDNVWSTKRVDALIKDIDKTGVIPRENPFFMRQINKRKADLVWDYTKEESFNMAVCKKFILEYAKRCKVMTKAGLAFIKLRPYQVVVLKKLTIHNFFIYLASRQIGKSIIIGIFISWIVTFFGDKACLLGSENLGKAKDLKAKIDVIIHNLPFYMQNGVVYFSTQRSIYDNGSKVISEPTTENFGVSGSFNVVYMDEFALLDDDMQDKIIRHVVPTLDSFGDEARFIISTTPRGKNNKFFHLFNDSLNNRNKFGNFTTKWYEVDGRGEAWKQEQIAIVGIEGFNQEYDLSFQADSTLLFGSDEQKRLDNSFLSYVYYPNEAREIINKHILPNRHKNVYMSTAKKSDYELPEGLEEYEISNIFAPPDDFDIHDKIISLRKGFHLDDLSDDSKQFALSVDLAGGVGKDYSVLNIFEIVPMSIEEILMETTATDETSFFKMVQVGIIRSNMLEVEDFAKFIYYFLTMHCEHKNFRLVLEINYEGGLFVKTLFEFNGEKNKLDQSDMLVEFPYNMDFEDAIKYKIGIKQNDKIKMAGVKSTKRLYNSNKLVINEYNTIYEAQGFGKNKKGKYEGTTKNDDCFVTVINISHYFNSEYFFDQIEEMFNHIDEDIQIEIRKKVGDGFTDDEDYGDFDAFDDN